MTLEQQRKVISEYLGHKPTANDLSEAEGKCWKPNRFVVFVTYLNFVANKDNAWGNKPSWPPSILSDEQRCEAIVRTLGKWE